MSSSAWFSVEMWLVLMRLFLDRGFRKWRKPAPLRRRTWMGPGAVAVLSGQCVLVYLAAPTCRHMIDAGSGGKTGALLFAVTMALAGPLSLGVVTCCTYTACFPGSPLIVWWVLPMVLCTWVRALVVGAPSMVEQARRRIAQALGAPVMRGPEFFDAVAQKSAVLVALTPLAGAVRAARPWHGGTWGPAVLCCLVAGSVWWTDRGIRPRTRYIRRGARLGVERLLCAALILAASPAGARLAASWRSSRWWSGPWGGAAVALAFGSLSFLPGLLARRARSSRRRMPKAVFLLAVPSWLLRFGYLPICLATWYAGTADDWVAVGPLVAVTLFWTVLSGGTDGFYVLEAGALLRCKPEERTEILGPWLFESFLAHPGKPDVSFALSLAHAGMDSAHGHHVIGLGLGRPGSKPLTGFDAFQCIDAARQAIAMVERSVVPVYPPEHGPCLERAITRVHLEIAIVEANVLQYLNQPEAALDAWRRAASHATAYGAPNLAASNRVGAANLLSGMLNRPTEALAEISADLLDERLSPVTRKHLLLSAGWAAAVSGELVNVEEARRKVRGLRIRRSDYRAVRRELDRTRPRLASLRVNRLMKELLKPLEQGLDVMMGEESNSLAVPRELDYPARIFFSQAQSLMESDPDRAGTLLEQSIAAATQDGHLTWVALSNMMLAALLDHDPAAAFARMLDAITAYEEIIARTSESDLRIDAGFRFGSGDLYANAALILLTADDDVPGLPTARTAAVFELLERGRNRVFLELLGSRARPPAEPALEPLVDEERRAWAEHAALSSTVSADGAGAPPPSRAIERRRQTRGRLEAAWSALAASGPPGSRYVNLRRGATATLTELLDVVRSPGDADAVLAVFHVVPNAAILLFVIRPTEDEPLMIPFEMTPERLRAAVDGMAPFTPAHLDDPGWQTPFRELAQPLVEATTPGQTLWIVPHDILHQVPFHAIDIDIDDRHNGTMPLGERNPICYSTSASVMMHCRARGGRPLARILVAADSLDTRPLIHSRSQAQLLHRIYADRADVLVGAAATRSAVLAFTGSANILHLACHGVFDAADPMNSGVLLAPEQNGPTATGEAVGSRLSAADFLNSTIDAGLVTLSACSTGQHHRRAGDELMGLTRALLFAGAPSVVVSLWEADDLATSLLMQRFYEELTAGRDKAEALRRAQKALRTMTITDVLRELDRIGTESPVGGDPRIALALTVDAARLHMAAGNAVEASRLFESVITETEPSAEGYRGLVRAAAHARRLASGGAQIVDYERTPYSSAYFWAPFVLHGDWR